MSTSSLSDHITDLAAQAFLQGAAAAIPGVVPRPWQLPSAYPSGTPPIDPAGFIVACDRTDLNEVAATAYATGGAPNAGRIGTIVAAKMAMDHIACHERALHARHALPVRLRTWAAARRTGHGSLPYGVLGAFAAAVDDAAAAATAAPNAQD